MARLVLHIGYPKTATSTIQNQLLYPTHMRGEINFLGKSDKYGFNPSGRFVHSMVFGDNVVEQLSLRDDLVNVISNEDFPLSFCNIDGQNYLKECHPEVTSKRLRENLVNCFDSKIEQVDIVVVLRNQVDLIHSCFVEGWRWYFRHEKSINTFEKYLSQGLSKGNQGIFAMFYFNEVIDSYIEHFGKEHVHVMFYEDLLFERESFCNSLADILGIHSQCVFSALAKKDNIKKKSDSGYVQEGISMFLFLSGLLNRSSVLKGLYNNIKLKSGIFNRLLEKMIAWSNSVKVSNDSVIPYIGDEVKERVLTEFQNENLNLAEKFSVHEKLVKYGYIKD